MFVKSANENTKTPNDFLGQLSKTFVKKFKKKDLLGIRIP